MKLNWGSSIGLVYLFFVGSMVTFAVVASRQTNELVTEKYYDDAVRYQKKIDARNNASSDENNLSISFLSESNELRLSHANNNSSVKGVIQFYKPDNAHLDFTRQFELSDNSEQVFTMDTLAHGLWKLKTSWVCNEKEFYSEKEITIKN